MDAIRLVDSHIHLQDYDPGTDIGALVEEAATAGITYLVCNGTSEESWSQILGFAESYPQVAPCLGIHPWFVPESQAGWISRLEDLVRKTPCGIGEIGLDRLREPYDKFQQEEAFRLQLNIAGRHNRPAMIHCVRAWGWPMDILRSEPKLPNGILLHSYGGSADLVKPLADMGTYFSFSGKALYTNYERARKALSAVPSDRLLIETDAPCMLPPEKYRARKIFSSSGEEFNHPANLPEILVGIAELLGESPQSLRERLWENSMRFFRPILEPNGGPDGEP